LCEDFLLADPLTRAIVRVGKFERHAIDFDIAPCGDRTGSRTASVRLGSMAIGLAVR
jgi:hypothetical protein